jgi:S1-C subfamily serine protease
VAIGAATTSSSTTTVQAAAPIPAANVSQTSSGISPAAIYRNDASGVVLITATSTSSGADPFDPLAPDQSQKSVAIGSGFVADAAGHVYTNAHVVLGASSVKVTFKTNATGPGATYNAKVLGADKATDVAVLQVEGAPASQLHPLPLGSLSSVHVGDPVVAIGNPLNEQSTITSGIVSQIGRTIDSLEPGQQIYRAIQTDAAINHGNSGGPLIDAAGRVIGVTSQISTGNTGQQGSLGIGFAIPINTVRGVAAQLIQNGKVEHAFIGISTVSVTTQLARLFKLPVDRGLLVQAVEKGSAADKAGIRVGKSKVIVGGVSYVVGGDVIVGFAGKTITTYEQLRDAISQLRPGDKAKLDIYRDGSRKTVTVTLGQAPK